MSVSNDLSLNGTAAAAIRWLVLQAKVLGTTIRQRIRQISIDDGNSMSDLAQLIIPGLESTSDNFSIDEQEPASPDLASTLPATLLGGKSSADDRDPILSHSNHFWLVMS